MNIAIACGGTGGHIFPGLATGEALKERGHEVKLWLSGKDIEKEALRGWAGETVTIPTTGLPARPGLQYVSALWRYWLAFRQCRREMRRDRPDVLLAFGGYGSVAPVLAAAFLSIPVILHEANVIPGRANRFLSRWAKVFALGFEETRSHIRHSKMVYTGIPLRGMKMGNVQVRSPKTATFPFPTGRANPQGEPIFPRWLGRPFGLAQGGDASPYLLDDIEPPTPQSDWNALKPGVFTILAMGGSRGAHALNDMTARAVTALHAGGKAIQVIHLTGTADESKIREIYRQSGVPHLVFAFLHAMEQAFDRTTLAICRAGGSTCAEIAHYGVPAVLIPYPHAASNHQFANARAQEAAGGADVIEEKDLTAERLVDYVSTLMADTARLERMRSAALHCADSDAAGALADLVVEIAQTW